MPDMKFYNTLWGRFSNDFPREFWEWLLNQDIQQPWWTRLNDEFTLRNYLQQMYQAFAPPPIQPTAQPISQPPAEPSLGWDEEKYLAAAYASLDADTVSKEVYDKMSDKEKAGVWSPENAKAEKERIANLVKASTDPTLLPGWGDYKKDWIYLNSTVKVQGQLFQAPDGAYYDMDANPVSAESAAQTMSDFYKTNQKQMSDYQKARLEFDIAEAKRGVGEFQQQQVMGREQFQQQQALAQQRQVFEREQLAEQRRQFDITQRRLSAERSNREKELQFDLERERQLAGWSAPSDWIRRWQLKNQPNPFTPVPMTLQQQVEAGLYEIEQARQQMLQFQGKARPEEFVETAQGWITPYEKNLQELTAKWLPVIQQQQATASQEAEAMEEVKARTGEYPKFQRLPTTPPAPAWLSQFAPGQVEGKPITAQNIVTPSGQQWARTPWSVREGVRGYSQWTQGKPFEEVIEEMESMLPYSPRGVASRRWIPTRQWG